MKASQPKSPNPSLIGAKTQKGGPPPFLKLAVVWGNTWSGGGYPPLKKSLWYPRGGRLPLNIFLPTAGVLQWNNVGIEEKSK
jgi:hypothetical protein